MTDQSDTGNPTAGLDADTVELTIEPLISHFNKPRTTDVFEPGKFPKSLLSTSNSDFAAGSAHKA
eukprot:236605-Prorocentrum_minimum.AAC.1